MSLAEFQRAFAELIASAERCVEARRRPADVFAQYVLSPRERARLEAIVNDPGMSANCVLYRVNRLVPVYSVLPLTCRLLGTDLLPELERYWASCEEATLQYRLEAWRFGYWLCDRIADGALAGGPVEDALAFELAAYEVRAAPHGSAARRRSLRFRYEPERLLDPESDPTDLALLPAPVEVTLDATGEALRVARVRELPRPT
jgi:hypothetical protein